MKKIYIIALVLSLILLFYPEKGQGTSIVVVLNQKVFGTVAGRTQVAAALGGEKGSFTFPVNLTLYCQSGSEADYRYIKSKLQAYGATVTIKVLDTALWFDFRAGGQLPLYVYNQEGSITDIFKSHNSEFYSTGFASEQYDSLPPQSQLQLLQAQVLVVWV